MAPRMERARLHQAKPGKSNPARQQQIHRNEQHLPKTIPKTSTLTIIRITPTTTTTIFTANSNITSQSHS